MGVVGRLHWGREREEAATVRTRTKLTVGSRERVSKWAKTVCALSHFFGKNAAVSVVVFRFPQIFYNSVCHLVILDVTEAKNLDICMNLEVAQTFNF